MRGIYKITNTVNNRTYIGQSENIEKRWMQHKNALGKCCHHCKWLQEDYIIFGADAFVYEKLEETSAEENLIIREQYWLEKYYFYKIEIYNSAKNKQGEIGFNIFEENRQKLLDVFNILKSKYGNNNFWMHLERDEYPDIFGIDFTTTISTIRYFGHGKMRLHNFYIMWSVEYSNLIMCDLYATDDELNNPVDIFGYNGIYG